ncbi:MAG: hypothetical protein WED10_03350 [Brumimicrobium sp.]
MKYLLLFVSVIVLTLTFLVGSAYLKRLNLNYNSEGNFYSLKENVVYTEQAVDVFGLLTIAGGAMSLLLIFGTIKYFRNIKYNKDL